MIQGLKLCVKVLLVLLALTLIQVFVTKFVDPPFTTLMAFKWLQGKLLADRHYEWPQYDWRPLKEISPHLIRAVQAGEDQRFLTHHGFDFTELNQALRDLLSTGRVRGASTITMQVARTVFLWPGRSWLRKLGEAYYTVLIEVLWDKRRILEIYLNTVDWGTGIIGAEAASRTYFHTSSSILTRSQAAILAAILPSPHNWSPGNPSAYLRERQKRIMKDMEKMPLL